VNHTSDTSPHIDDATPHIQELPQRILLLEDDHAHAQLIARALKGSHSIVTHKETVADALEYIRTHEVDLVLTDLNLVTESGFDLIAKLRQSSPHLPLIVLTSSSNLNDAVRAMREGAWDYVSKHFSGNFSIHLELVIQRTWERAIQKHRELEAQAERNAFWMASSLAEDGLAILDTNGLLLYKNSVFDRFLSVLNATGKSGKNETSNVVSLIAQHDFRLSQNLFSQIHVNNDSLWKSQLKCTESGKGTAYYFDLRLSTVISENRSNNIEATNHDSPGINEIRYHILWTRDITNEKKAREFETNLLSSTTHDLKGPLSAILTSTEMLLEEEISTPFEKSIHRIASCAKTSLGLIDQLLSVKTLQDGILEIKPKWIDLSDVAYDVFEEFDSVAKSKNIKFNFIRPDNEVPTFADLVSVKRIIGNLLSNALKFTPKDGEIVLEVELLKDASLIKVSDNGDGIAPEMQGILFEMYGRLPEHEEIGGTGLGLYITKQLVDMHEGVIELKSSQKVGTTFSVYLKKELEERYRIKETAIIEKNTLY
jgi:signal transduction histidine kinase